MTRQIYKIVDPNNLGRFYPLTQRKFYSPKTAWKAIHKEFCKLTQASWYWDIYTKDLPDVIELDIVSNGEIISRETYTVRKKDD